MTHGDDFIRTLNEEIKCHDVVITRQGGGCAGCIYNNYDCIDNSRLVEGDNNSTRLCSAITIAVYGSLDTYSDKTVRFVASVNGKPTKEGHAYADLIERLRRVTMIGISHG